jgi:hypothetical protein
MMGWACHRATHFIVTRITGLSTDKLLRTRAPPSYNQLEPEPELAPLLGGRKKPHQLTKQKEVRGRVTKLTHVSTP